MFDLNKQGEFTVKLAEPIEDFDRDQYGNQWHNVLFEGDAETYMWLAKNPPEEGKTYWGHIEKTKSGKRLRFKTDQRPDDVYKNPSKSSPAAGGKTDSYLKDMSNTPILMYNGSLHYAKDLGLNLVTDKNDRRVYLEYIQEVSNEMLDMVDKVRGSGGSDNASPSRGLLSPKPAIKAGDAPATASLGDKFRARQASMEPPPSDEDNPYDG